MSNDMNQKNQDQIIINDYRKLINDVNESNNLFDPTISYEELINIRKEKIKALLVYTHNNLEFVKRHEQFRLAVGKKILKWYFEGNIFEKEIANEYKFLLDLLRNKIIHPIHPK